MSGPADFFNLPEADPIRSGGRPSLVPEALEGMVDPIRSLYTRASGMADNIENKDHIHKWEMRYLAKAMGRNDDLAALAAVEPYSTGLSDAVFGRAKSASGRRLDSIIERALDRARIHEKADRGTAVHGATEPGVVPTSAVPERMRDDVAAFFAINEAMGIKIVGTEMFTANDETMSAGTFDHLVEVPGDSTLDCLVIADKKTGRFSPFEWCVQLSTYARGKVYDTTTDRRVPWPDEVNLDYGLVWQIGDGKVKLWVVDLRFGWEMAKLAAAVRDGHDRTDIAQEWRPTPFAIRLQNTHTADGLRTLWTAATTLEQRAAVEQKASTL